MLSAENVQSANHQFSADDIFSSPELCSGWAIVITFHPSSVRPCVCLLTFSNDYSSEAAEPILLKFHMEPP